MALKQFLMIGVVAAVLVACVGNRNSETSPSSVIPQSSDSEISVSSNSVPVAYVDPSTVVKGTMTDERDGQTYKTVTIGTQTWMAENLNYAYGDILHKNRVHIFNPTSWCYGNDSVYCAKYGRLYIWAAAMDSMGRWTANGKNCGLLKTCSPTYPVRGICPEGWHLPNYDEWATLIVAVDGSIREYNKSNTAGGKLKSTTNNWNSAWNGGGNETDVYGFSALPAGFREYGGNFEFEGDNAFFWSSTERNRDYAWYMDLHSNNNANLNYDLKQSGFSVRCVKDEVSEQMSSSSVTSKNVIRSSSDSETRLSSSSVSVAYVKPSTVVKGTMTDERDGKTYKTVKIGTQTWMAENLNYAYTGVPFIVGDYISDSTSWCYDNDPANCAKYGRLYTWSAVMDSVGTWSENGKGCGYKTTCSATYPVRGICPEGWHVPDTTDWETLEIAVSGSDPAGKKLKAAPKWNRTGTWNGTDNYSFSALPAGYRSNNSFFDFDFSNKGFFAVFWSSTERGSDVNYIRLDYNSDYMFFVYNKVKDEGMPVRCVKDEVRSSVTPKSGDSETSVSSSSSVKSSSSSVAYVDPSAVVKGTMTDKRDGKTYKTVTIGTQTWMAENLNYAYTGVPFKYNWGKWEYPSDSTSWCYGDDAANCAKYGRHYTWAAAMDSVGEWSANGKGCGAGKTCSPTYPVRGICPQGWHLPESTEWETLFAAVGEGSGKNLRSTSIWISKGTDTYSFSALPAGQRDCEGNWYFDTKGYQAFFWSSTEYNDENAYDIYLHYVNRDAYLNDSGYKNYGYSVRCVKD